MVLQFFCAAVLWCCSAIVMQCHGAAVLWCCSARLLQCFIDAVLLWFCLIMPQSCWFLKSFIQTYRHTYRAIARGPIGPKNNYILCVRQDLEWRDFDLLLEIQHSFPDGLFILLVLGFLDYSILFYALTFDWGLLLLCRESWLEVL